MTPREQLAAWDRAVSVWRASGEPERLLQVVPNAREIAMAFAAVPLPWALPNAVGSGL